MKHIQAAQGANMVVAILLVLSAVLMSLFLTQCRASPATFSLVVEVRDVFANDLPDQLVQVFRGTEPKAENLILQGYTPLYRVTGFDRRVLLFQIDESMLGDKHDLFIRTTNLTQAPSKDLTRDWDLAPQWLTRTLSLEELRSSPHVTLRWPAKLQLTVHAGDKGTFLKNAWVFIFDATSNYNVTAALTDDYGYAGSVALPTPVAFPAEPLASSDGKKLNLGFNLLRGKYIIRVYFKSDGSKGLAQSFGKVDGTTVWDTFRDEPQHRFVYMITDVTFPAIPIPVPGQSSIPSESPSLLSQMLAEATASGEVQTQAAQARVLDTKVFSTTVLVVDQSPHKRLVAGSTIAMGAFAVVNGPQVTFPLVPGGKYTINVEADTAYGTARLSSPITVEITGGPLTVEIALPIYDATVKILSPSANPIVGASVKVGTVNLGSTNANGSVAAIQIPGGTYSVSVSWFGKDVSPHMPLVVFESGTYVLTASRIEVLQVEVVGAQNQGLGGSFVTITPTGTTTPIFSGVSDPYGVIVLEVPFGSYDIKVSSRGVQANVTVNVIRATLQKINTGIFIEIFGRGLTFPQFVVGVIGVLAMVVGIFLLYVYWKRRPAQLPPPPPPE